MSSFKSTDLPYSQLCQAADEDHEFINLEELNQCHLNELDVLTQSSGYELPNQSLTTTHASTTTENINSHSSQRDSQQYHGQPYSQIMYQTLPQQAQYDQQLQTDETILSQPYSPLNQNHYHYYPRNYDQGTDPDLHLYHSQMYPQQPVQNQFYYHINSLNTFNENLNRCIHNFFNKQFSFWISNQIEKPCQVAIYQVSKVKIFSFFIFFLLYFCFSFFSSSGNGN